MALQSSPDVECAIIGRSRAINLVRLQLKTAATMAVKTLLLTGESGTGKELAAQSFYEHLIQFRNRQEKKFVTVDCASLPEDLLERELFGHERGSFTGAFIDKTGLLERADGGVAFIDEIGHASSKVQRALLRYIETGEIRPIGSTKTKLTHAHVVVATNKDLATAARNGEFLPDLLWRLDAVQINLPPLRDRPEDIPSLVEYYLGKLSERYDNEFRLDPDVLDYLSTLDWPGNVRQLKHALERVVFEQWSSGITRFRTSNFHFLMPVEAPNVVVSTEESKSNTGVKLGDDVSLAVIKRSHIESVTKRYTLTQAAKILGISYRSLSAAVRELGIVRPDRRGVLQRRAAEMGLTPHELVEQTLKACKGDMIEAATELNISASTVYSYTKRVESV